MTKPLEYTPMGLKIYGPCDPCVVHTSLWWAGFWILTVAVVFALGFGLRYIRNLNDQSARDGSWHAHNDRWRRMTPAGKWEYRDMSAAELKAHRVREEAESSS